MSKANFYGTTNLGAVFYLAPMRDTALPTLSKDLSRYNLKDSFGPTTHNFAERIGRKITELNEQERLLKEKITTPAEDLSEENKMLLMKEQMLIEQTRQLMAYVIEQVDKLRSSIIANFR